MSQNAPSNKPKFPPHIYRELVNRLRDAALLAFKEHVSVADFARRIIREFSRTEGMLLVNPTYMSGLVGELLDVTIKYRNTQQFRTQVELAVGRYIEPDHESTRS